MPAFQHVSCEMMLASFCNLSCKYCIAGKLHPSKMDINTARKAIELFVYLAEGASDLEVVFTGGEPLLAQEVFIFLLSHTTALCDSIRMKPHFILKTNGTIITDTLVQYLKDFRVRTVVSIDGRADFHDSCRMSRKGEATQNLVMRNLSRLESKGIECVASMTVVPEFSNQIVDNTRYLLGNGIRKVDIGPAYGTVTWSNEEIKRLTDSLLQIAEIIKASRMNGEDVEIGPLYKDSDHQDGALADTWGCHACSSNLAFLPEGDISGCSSLAMLSPKHPELIIGNVENGVDQPSLDAVLHLVQASLSYRPICKKCNSAENCSGGCLAINLSEKEMPHIPPNFYCACIGILPKALRLAWN
ncbi:MAG TPA: radical SAM protein, partial [Candidatus Hodarchaeales archaeon]|nr:radical SAM protein [Candidatus Hodarchaeales archaeon]